jgi:2-polyprenyl-3-methyl-5-hydroxy-6-metoxy-1,4-benzoquinol methylase
MSNYDYEAEIPRHEGGNSHSVMVDLIGPDRRVLDVGSASGYLARALVAQGCTVAGIDNDAEAVEKSRDVVEHAVVADLNVADLVAEFGAASQDVVVFGDVLEHVLEPGRLVRQARRVLAPGGFLVISIPNVAHGDVRLSLFRGVWDYHPTGLLDQTHIRFFTDRTIRELLLESGFAVTDTRFLRRPLFDTELNVREVDIPAGVVAAVRAQPDHDVYQLVLRAVPDDADAALTMLAAHDHQLQQQIAALEADVSAARHEIEMMRVHGALAADAAEQLASARVELALERRRSAELDRLRATRVIRWSAVPRRAYSALRRMSA